MDKDTENWMKNLYKQANLNKKEKINSQLERLLHLQQRGVIKYHEIAQLNELRRELAEIEFSERKRTSSNPPFFT